MLCFISLWHIPPTIPFAVSPRVSHWHYRYCRRRWWGRGCWCDLFRCSCSVCSGWISVLSFLVNTCGGSQVGFQSWPPLSCNQVWSLTRNTRLIRVMGWLRLRQWLWIRFFGCCFLGSFGRLSFLLRLLRLSSFTIFVDRRAKCLCQARYQWVFVPIPFLIRNSIRAGHRLEDYIQCLNCPKWYFTQRQGFVWSGSKLQIRFPVNMLRQFKQKLWQWSDHGNWSRTLAYCELCRPMWLWNEFHSGAIKWWKRHPAKQMHLHHVFGWIITRFRFRPCFAQKNWQMLCKETISPAFISAKPENVFYPLFQLVVVSPNCIRDLTITKSRAKVLFAMGRQACLWIGFIIFKVGRRFNNPTKLVLKLCIIVCQPVPFKGLSLFINQTLWNCIVSVSHLICWNIDTAVLGWRHCNSGADLCLILQWVNQRPANLIHNHRLLALCLHESNIKRNNVKVVQTLNSKLQTPNKCFSPSYLPTGFTLKPSSNFKPSCCCVSVLPTGSCFSPTTQTSLICCLSRQGYLAS